MGAREKKDIERICGRKIAIRNGNSLPSPPVAVLLPVPKVLNLSLMNLLPGFRHEIQVSQSYRYPLELQRTAK